MFKPITLSARKILKHPLKNLAANAARYFTNV